MSKSDQQVLCAVFVFGVSIHVAVAVVFLSLYNNAKHQYDRQTDEYIIDVTTSITEPRGPNKYIREPMNIVARFNESCFRDKPVAFTLVTFIKSKVDYFQRRELLRRTWNSISYLDGGRFEAVYLIGKTSHPPHVALLDEEEERYGDILQYDGPDEYRMMPYKVLAGMEWASKHFPSNTLYASADDDIITDLRTMTKNIKRIIKSLNVPFGAVHWSDEARISFLQHKQTHEHTGKLQNITKLEKIYRTFPIICMYVKGTSEAPWRTPHTKWYVTYDEYRYNSYPPYCHGGMYVMSLIVARDLYNTSLTAPILRLDDVWITGILRRRSQISDNLVYDMTEVATHLGSENNDIFAPMSKKWDDIYRTFRNHVQCRRTFH